MLHLGALAVVVTLAYLGLDRQIRGSLSELDTVLDEIGGKLERVINTHDLRSASGVVNIVMGDAWPTYCTYLACVIAQKDYKIRPLIGITFLIRRQYSIPLLRYFRSKADFYVVTFLHLICLSSFLIICTIDLCSVDPGQYYIFFLIALLSIYALSITWITISVYFILRLQRIRVVSEYCIRAIEARAEYLIGVASKLAQNAIERKIQELPP